MRKLCLLLSIAAFGCASQETPKPKNVVYTESKSNMRFDNSSLKRQIFDMNNDGQIDLWKYYSTKKAIDEEGAGESILTRKELDLNFDGTIDRIMYYNQNESLIREEIDTDFNGHIDRIYYYDNALVVKTEIYSPKCAQIIIDSSENAENIYPSVTRHYSKGILTREENDETCDGIRETVLIFDKEGKLSQTGKDHNGDGVIEEWIRY